MFGQTGGIAYHLRTRYHMMAETRAKDFIETMKSKMINFLMIIHKNFRPYTEHWCPIYRTRTRISTKVKRTYVA